MWTAFVGWWTNNPVVRLITYILLALIGWEVVKRHLKEAGRDAERKAIAVKQAQVRVAVNERSSEIIQTERDYADAALEARDRDNPRTPYDELPERVKSVLNRSEGGS